jgi:regulator of sigma E protease
VDGQRVVSAPAGSGLTAGDIVVQADDASAVLRGVTSRQVSVTPALAPDPDNPDANIGRLGIVMDTARATVRYGPVAAARQGLRTTSEMSLTLVGALAQMIRDLSPNQLSGPVEIAKISRQQAEAGFVPFFMFMAVLSVNLGLINLLPIPALDGGRLLFIAFEALRGRRVDPAREQLVHLIGFVLVLSLMAVLTVAELAGRGP